MRLNNCVKNCIDIVILAAGKGSRMQSALPKVLQVIGGKPMLGHVLDTAKALAPKNLVVVYGHGGEAVLELFANEKIIWKEQNPCLGTGHALQQAMPELRADRVLVLYGDVPLVSQETLKQLLTEVDERAVGFLSMKLCDPGDFGRVKRDPTGVVLGIVEAAEATPIELAIREVNTGVLVAPRDKLEKWLSKLSNHNAKQEYYLTDILAMAFADKVALRALAVSEPLEMIGINTPSQLVMAERYYQQLQAAALLEKGVRLRCKDRIEIRGVLQCGRDVSIDINNIFTGNNQLGDFVSIEANCIINNCIIENGAKILAFSHLEGAVIGPHAVVGPFARLRPGTNLKAHSRVGNFVEVKNTTLGEYSKANHLTYLGDTKVGSSVNIGAGTITCNYDGAHKYQTVIEDGAFIGCDTQLVAPVTVGRGATIAAGTTVLKDVPAEQLTLNPKTQSILEGWMRPVKNKDN